MVVMVVSSGSVVPGVQVLGFAAVNMPVIVWVGRHWRELGGVPGDGCKLGGLRHAQALAASCGGLVGQQSPSAANLGQGHGTDADTLPKLFQGLDDLALSDAISASLGTVSVDLPSSFATGAGLRGGFEGGFLGNPYTG